MAGEHDPDVEDPTEPTDTGLTEADHQRQREDAREYAEQVVADAQGDTADEPASDEGAAR
jgi:hypothetical protein